MKINNLNTVDIIRDLEKQFLSVSRKMESAIKENLKNIDNIETNLLKAVENQGSLENKEKAVEAKYERLINSNDADLDRKIREVENEYNNSVREINSKISALKKGVDNEYYLATSYLKKINEFVEMCQKFLRGEEKTRIGNRYAIRWDKSDNDYEKFERKADRLYDKLFERAELPIDDVEIAIANETKRIIDSRNKGFFKSLMDNAPYCAMGNIALIMKNLYAYQRRTNEELSKERIANKCKESTERIAALTKQGCELTSKKVYDIDELRAKYSDKKHKELGPQRVRELATVKAQHKEMLEKLNSEAAKRKEENSISFIRNKNKIKNELISWLDDNFSIEYINTLEQYRSHISDHSDTEDYTEVVTDNHYVRLGKIELNYQSSQLNINSELVSWITEYYEEMNFDGVISIPFIIDFTNFSNMQLKCRNSQDNAIVQTIRSMTLHFFGDIKAGNIHFTFIDHSAQGSTFAPFMQFIADNPTSKAIINQSTCATSEHSDDAVSVLENACMDINKNRYVKNYANIIEYNTESAPNTLPINIIFVMDYAASISPQALQKIDGLTKHSKRCGFHFIFVGESARQNGNSLGLPPINMTPNDIGVKSDSVKDEERLVLKHIGSYDFSIDGTSAFISFDRMYSDSKLEKMAPQMAEILNKSGRIVVPMNKINKTTTAKDIGENISIPFALVGANNIKSLTFGDSYSKHAVITGLPRAGKSNLIHILLLKALETYTPDELQIYLLDYKMGVEAYEYSRYRLPHFAVISTTHNITFGKNTLMDIEAIMLERTSVFNSYGCTEFGQYHKKRKKDPDMPSAPRILVIIDELHRLFEKAENAKFFGDKLDNFIRTSSSYGIHFIFSSQFGSDVAKIKSETSSESDSALNMITAAIVFKSDAQTEKIILGEESKEVQFFQNSDSGLAIYAQDRANPRDNIRVMVGKRDVEEEDRRLQMLQLKYKDTECKTRVNAAELDNRIGNPVYELMTENAIYASKKPEFIHGNVTIGENLDTDIEGNINFNGNMAVIGENNEIARAFFGTMMTSILCEGICNKRPIKVKFIELTERIKPVYAKLDAMYILCDKLSDNVLEYFNCVQTEEAEESAISAVNQSDADGTEVYFFVYGATGETAGLLNNLIQATMDNKRIHVIVWSGTYSVFEECVDIEYHKYLNHRIVFGTDSKDTKKLVNKEVDLKEADYALYRNIKSPESAREYSAFMMKNSVFQEKLAARLKSYVTENN